MLTIKQEAFERMLEQLRQDYPLEGCGLMAGQAGFVQKLYPVTNSLASPTAYEMEPVEQLAAMLDMEAHNWDLLAIYHSHPNGPEVPSRTDIDKAYYPEAVHVIVSWRDLDHPSARVFNIVEGQVTEISLRIV